MKKTILNLVAIFYFFCSTSAQTNLDSLWNLWEDKSIPDTVRLEALNTFSRQGFLFSNPDSAFKLSVIQYNYSEKIGSQKWMAAALNTQGVSFHIQGNYYKAIKYYNKGLKISESIGDTKLMANTLNNIGIIYREQQNHDKALVYFKKSFKLKKQIGDKLGAANSLGNIGGVYSSKNQRGKALDYYNRGLSLLESEPNNRTKAGFINNIGTIYLANKNYEKAKEYLNEGLKMRIALSDLRSTASSYISLGRMHIELKQFKEAVKFNKKALDIAQKVGLLKESMEASKYLYESYKKENQLKESLKMLEFYILMKDSLGSDKNKQEVVRQEFKYQYEKQHLADSLEFVKKEELKEIEHNTILRQEQNQRYILYGGILFLILLASLTYRSYSQKKKNNITLSEKNNIIIRQKEIVEEKNQEITDSIQYAKRIQNAILPPTKLVKEYLANSFVYYKPKDIVAGDFYWMETVDYEENMSNSETPTFKSRDILFAAADCTGHGVPGAMVSVVCNNGLNRSVREHKLTDPGKILDKTREIVVQEFEKSEEEVKDGMDIALCSLKQEDGRWKLKYAGAHNPLWIIRGEELLETKANKQPIGKFDNPEPYTTHNIELQKGDSIYIFSDGYADQFGGEEGKKLKTSNFKKLLLSIQNETMDKQKQLLEDAFEKWKGDIEQLDDVCVIGVRI